MTPAEITAAAKSFEGVRWLHQGRSRSGIDCAGLVVLVARQLGLEVQDMHGYGREPNRNKLRQILESQLVRVLEPSEGCVLLMRFVEEPQHLAIVVDNGEIVHAYAQVRRVVRHPLDATWRSRIVDAYKFEGMT